ncbi:DNA double-strand break repair protein isoform X2 [Tasmannia lanceolata]|uniref:DNA double-strand break repair protein isoform X2 n=1 Tax=Tasmannia lanceolata TaxID=3420 RepID=UPI004063988F
MDFSREDAKTLWSQIQHEENLLKIKRGWLLALPRIPKPNTTKMQFKTPKLLKNVSLHESFLRDDDVSYEAVRTSVERCFGTFTGKKVGQHVVQDYLRLFDMNRADTDAFQPSNIFNIVSSLLDDLNNIGLFRLANIVTGNSIVFEKTRPRMKKVIKEYLQKVLRESNHKDLMELVMRLSRLFKGPTNLRKNDVKLLTHASSSLLSSANKVLEGLDDLCILTLVAMHRKLRGVPFVPKMHLSRSNLCKDRLVEQVRNTCYSMLPVLTEGDELPEQLAKAMSVAGLSLKQIGGLSDFPIPQFLHFSPEIEALQNDIIKAIHTLPKVKHFELKDLQSLLDPKAEIPMKKFRRATRRLLVNCLFECSEIDIPESFLGAIAFINRKSRRQLRHNFSKNIMEEEVECVLNISSQLRQITWEMLPDHSIVQDFDHSIDQDFADAYMDDLVGDDNGTNDDRDLDDDKNCFDFRYFNKPACEDAQFGQCDGLQIYGSHSGDEVESVGDSRPVVSPQHITTNESSSLQLMATCKDFNHNSMDPESKQIARTHLRHNHCFGSSPCAEDLTKSCSRTSEYDGQNNSKNQYLFVQDICDEASLVAHQLIGRLLEGFLHIEGVDLNSSTRSYLRGGASIPEDLQEESLLSKSLVL